MRRRFCFWLWSILWLILSGGDGSFAGASDPPAGGTTGAGGAAAGAPAGAPAPSASGSQGPPRAGAPGPPPPVPMTYKFQADVLAEMTADYNRDGKPDSWCWFENAVLVRYEVDGNHDGQPDWRETWDPRQPPPAAPELTIQKIQGRWRIMPYNVFRSFLGGNPVARPYTGRARKWDGRKWVATFQDRVPMVHETIRGEDERVVTRWTVLWTYQDGKPIEALVERDGVFSRVTWRDGIPLRAEGGTAKDKLLPAEIFTDGEPAERVWYDTQGRPDWRILGQGKGKEPRFEGWRDGKWVGDFETQAKDAQGRVLIRYVYRDGKQALYEEFRYSLEDGPAGKVFRRWTYRNDATREEELFERRGVERRRFWTDPQTGHQHVEKGVDGKWVGDYAEGEGSYPTVFKGGRLARVAYLGVIGDEGRRIGSFSYHGNQERQEWGDGKAIRYVLVYECAPAKVKRLVKEERDEDGDGVREITVDYERLTVSQDRKD